MKRHLTFKNASLIAFGAFVLSVVTGSYGLMGWTFGLFFMVTFLALVTRR